MPEQETTPSAGDLENANAHPARLVWNPFLAEFTGQSPARMRRRELSADCAFCADLTSGRVAPGSQTWARPNDFPAFTPPTGECLILIYSPDHHRSFADLSVGEVMGIVALWQRVYAELSPRYPCVMTWETSGEEIGQTQRHPHGQTYAIRELPDVLVRERAAIELAEREGLGCPFCAEAGAESNGPRVVHAGEHWVGFVPPYARYPYQVRLTPRRHVPAVTGFQTDADAARELSSTLLRLVRAYSAAYQAPMPYMLGLHQLDDPRFHFHIELLPVGRAPGKLKLAASSEMAWGFWMNDSFPEEKAAELRELLSRDEPA